MFIVIHTPEELQVPCSFNCSRAEARQAALHSPFIPSHLELPTLKQEVFMFPGRTFHHLYSNPRAGSVPAGQGLHSAWQEEHPSHCPYLDTFSFSSSSSSASSPYTPRHLFPRESGSSSKAIRKGLLDVYMWVHLAFFAYCFAIDVHILNILERDSWSLNTYKWNLNFAYQYPKANALP